MFLVYLGKIFAGDNFISLQDMKDNVISEFACCKVWEVILCIGLLWMVRVCIWSLWLVLAYFVL